MYMYYIIIQKWARAYRDGSYHAAVNTNNGAETLNKVLKYSFLPKKNSLLLSRVVSLIIDDFLPLSYQKYLFQNYRQSTQYRSYKSFVPDYLCGRPRSTILHCLERKTKALKYSLCDTSVIDLENGKFTVKGTKSKIHTIDFGTGNEDHMPSCTCQDWTQWHMPCKHFFGIFNLYPQWGWYQLPNEYLNSAYLSTDTDALQCKFSSTPPDDIHTSEDVHVPDDSSTISPVVDEIPTHKVIIDNTVNTEMLVHVHAQIW